jgi:hypothetical protein
VPYRVLRSRARVPPKHNPWYWHLVHLAFWLHVFDILVPFSEAGLEGWDWWTEPSHLAV